MTANAEPAQTGPEWRAELEAGMLEKAQGDNSARSEDWPQAIEHYEAAFRLVLLAQAWGAIPKKYQVLGRKDTVQYDVSKFGVVAYRVGKDYVLMDLGTRDFVKHKVGRHNIVSRFTRQELATVPLEVLGLRLSVLLDIAFTSILLILQGSSQHADLDYALRRADDVLALEVFMDAPVKALLRWGQAKALMAFQEWNRAEVVLAAAWHESKGQDVEVRVLRKVIRKCKRTCRPVQRPRACTVRLLDQALRALVR